MVVEDAMIHDILVVLSRWPKKGSWAMSMGVHGSLCLVLRMKDAVAYCVAYCVRHGDDVGKSSSGRIHLFQKRNFTTHSSYFWSVTF